MSELTSTEVALAYEVTSGAITPEHYTRRMGQISGFPACCIEAFIADEAAGRNPLALRGCPPGRAGYVPCAPCKERLGY